MKIYTLPNIFWGKKTDENGRYQWLPLCQHLEDTYQVAGRLWELWLTPGQKKSIIRSMTPASEEIAKSTFLFLAATHDIGKATIAFQVKPGRSTSTDFDNQLIDALECYGFAGLATAPLADISASPHALAGQFLLQEFGVNEEIASIVGGHHGKPVDTEEDLNDQKGYPSNYYQIQNSNHPVHQLWRNHQRAFFERALEIAGFDDVDELPHITQPGQVILSGALIMADWISSNENYFPLIDWENPVEINQEDRRENGWEKWEKTEPIQFKDINCLEQFYEEERFKFGPRNFQIEFAEIIEECDEPGIFVLEAPMGLGKTEAALVGAEQLAYKTERSGLFFALPTQATSDSMFSRVEDWLERVTNQYGTKSSIQLMHGKAALNDKFASLASQVNPVDQEDGVQVNQWFSGRKKSILDDYVVGTIDQFLLVALKQKHLALRHLGFSKKVVVIDEAHANDTYMNVYMKRALEWMGAHDVPVIILSATLPKQTRERLVFSYLQGKGLRPNDIEFPESGFAVDNYPLVTYTDGNKVIQYSDFKPDKEAVKTIQIRRMEEDHIWQQLDSWMDGEGVIGIIVNTVMRAQEFAQNCAERYGEDYVEVLHSSFIATGRKKKEQDLLDSIGKNSKRPKRKIIIGTQVIEQSLDIDFDVMISDLAPMDLLIQRVGRLHRHEITRPDQHVEPVLYVMGCSDEYKFEGGSAAIYGDYLLIRTQYYLPDKLITPDDISPLVQKVYGDEELALSDELQEHYQKANENEKYKKAEKERKAGNYLLSEPETEIDEFFPVSLIGWLNEMPANQSEEHGYAQVRDSDESIEVIAVKRCEDGYCMFGSDKDISEQIDDFETSRQLATNTIKLPGALSRSYNIERVIDWLESYNKVTLDAWQRQSWLKGQLGIVFDENNQFRIDGIEEDTDYLLTYSEKYGLSMEKVNKDEQL